MKSLEDLSLIQRLLLVAVIVAVVLLGLWLIASFDRKEASAAPAPSKYDRDLLELDRQAVHNAYKRRLEHLFEVWMTDPIKQPQRATTGAANARRAYIDAMDGIEKREATQ
jgi:hypothetical protein